MENNQLTEARFFSASKVLLEINDKSEFLSADELLQMGLEECEKLTNSNIAFLHLINPDQKTLTLNRWSSNTLKYCKVPEVLTHYPIDSAGIWVECIEAKKPVIHNDYNLATGKKGMPDGHAEIIRELTVPVFEKGKAVIIVGVGNKPDYYDETDQKIVQLISENLWSILRRKKAEEELFVSRDKYKLIVENQNDLIVKLDKDLNIKYANLRYCQTYGLSETEVINKNFLTLTFNESINSVRKKINEIFTYPFTCQFDELLHLENNNKWIQWVNKGIPDSKGKIYEIISVGRDVTDIIKQENFYKTILDQIINPVFITDEFGNITYSCTNVRHILKLKEREEFNIKNLRGFINKIPENLFEMQPSQNISFESTISDSNGEILQVYCTASCMDSHNYLFIMQDITELVAQSERLKNYEKMVSATSDTLALLDRELNYVVINESYKRRTGKEPNELLGKKVYEIWDDEIYNGIVKTNLEKCLNGEIVHFRKWFNFKNEGERYLDVMYEPIGTNNHVDFILVSTRDLTELKKSEQLVTESETRFETISKLISDYAYEFEVDEKRNLFPVWVSDAFERITGFSLEESEKRGGWAKLIYPEDLPQVMNRFEKLMKGETDVSEFRIIAKDGKIKWLRDYAKPVILNGKIISILGAAQDITGSKKNEKALIESEIKYRNLIENSLIGVGISKGEEIQFANKRLLDIYEIESLEELKKKSLTDYIHPDDKWIVNERIEKIKSGTAKFPINYNIRIITGNGQVKTLSVLVSEGDVNEESTSQVFIRDITDEIILERNKKKLAAENLLIAEKNKLINDLKKHILKLTKDYNFDKKDLKPISQLFDSFSDQYGDWEKVKVTFEEIHANFFTKLNHDYPGLSGNELRHCAYIKLNLTTKEIARLFNVKSTSIQKARVRLKKKLKLDRNEDLSSFIKQL